MINLSLSILFTTFLFVIFKCFDKYGVNNLQGIVFNYLFASLIGFSFQESAPTIPEIITRPWFPFAVFLGALFISLFNIMSYTAQKIGLSVTSVSLKMSVVIPVTFAIIYFHDSINIFKVIGICTALVAVYFTCLKEKDKTKVIDKRAFLFPVILFFGSGVMDTLINYSQKLFVPESEIKLYVSVIFLTACICGGTIMLFQIISGKRTFKIKSISWGFLLGACNFGSIFFFIKALQNPLIESSVTLSVNNVGIVMLSALLGLLLFKEKLSYKNIAGISLSLLAILIISFS